jgi:ABC-type uncharacterized transport system substrate-binding protein
VSALLLALGLPLGSALCHAQSPSTVALLLSEPGGIHAEAADSLRRELEADGDLWRVRREALGESTNASTNGNAAEVRVAIGLKALLAALAEDANTPLLALLVPRASFERVLAEHGARGKTVSALYLDQPLARQLALIRLALPEVRRVGVPLGPSSSMLAEAVERASVASRVLVRIGRAGSGAELFPALDAMAPEVDALLLLPDSVVTQRATLASLFLHAYRKRLPVVAYSAPMSQAGAVLSVYATPAQLGVEAARWLRESRQAHGIHLGAPRYPEAFTVTSNRNVARSLDLRLADDATLERRLREARP